MVIGIDIDNTMTNSKQKANEYYATYEFKEDGDSYTKMPEEKRRKFLDIYCLDIMKNCTLKDGVKEVFDYLNAKGHKILLITRRGLGEPEEVKDITIEYFKDKGIIYDKIYFEVENKGVICKDEKVDLFMDDHLFNLDSVNEVGIDCLLFGIKERKHVYNHVTNWKEVLEYIKMKGF